MIFPIFKFLISVCKKNRKNGIILMYALKEASRKSPWKKTLVISPGDREAVLK